MAVATASHSVIKCYTLAVMNLAIMFGFGPQELLLILLIVVVMFGASKIPQLMRGLGTGIKEFKVAVKDDDDEKPSLPEADNDQKAQKE